MSRVARVDEAAVVAFKEHKLVRRRKEVYRCAHTADIV